MDQHTQTHCCIAATRPTAKRQSPHPLQRRSETTTTAASLEGTIRSRLADDDESPIRISESDDAALLRCRSARRDGDADDDEGRDSVFGFAKESSVDVSFFEPERDREIGLDGGADGCCCVRPRGKWRGEKPSVDGGRERLPPSPEPRQRLDVLNLTKMQLARRSGGGDARPRFDAPGKVFRLLRSTLPCPSGLHCASPWYRSQKCRGDRVVAFLVNRPAIAKGDDDPEGDSDFWDDLEERERNELVEFRTGDAAPSFYLHATVELGNGSGVDGIDAPQFEEASSSSDATKFSELLKGASAAATLLVYRHLPPRDVLTVQEPIHAGCRCSPQTADDETYRGCLWERYVEHRPSEADAEEGLEDPPPPTLVVKHRIISPPYLSHEQEYPGLLDAILNSIDEIRDEARRIPQWTAWPERNHYSSSSAEEDENDPCAAWTVFPLCHTFPADDVRRRKFIETTCSFVPTTTSLLEGLGPALRTALFSRLGGRTTLGTHTGWEDLANHVLRVHVPLIVPPGGLCGTWVDGCVETHDEGRPIVFDDSRNHRAFCYGDDERIVLILDLERPHSLPRGTATGGHTEELDRFIGQLT